MEVEVCVIQCKDTGEFFRRTDNKGWYTPDLRLAHVYKTWKSADNAVRCAGPANRMRIGGQAPVVRRCVMSIKGE